MIDVELLRRRDPVACERFVHTYLGQVYQWFQWMTGSPEHADDLTQETFAAFWESLPRVRNRDVRPWLYGIARNCWRQYARTRSAACRVADSGGPSNDQTPSSSERVSDTEFARSILALMQRLPDNYRMALVFRYWQDMSYDEIATIQCVPPVLARWRAFRGRKLLKRHLLQTFGPDIQRSSP